MLISTQLAVDDACTLISTSMSVLVILEQNCTLAASRAAPWRVTLIMPRACPH